MACITDFGYALPSRFRPAQEPGRAERVARALYLRHRYTDERFFLAVFNANPGLLQLADLVPLWERWPLSITGFVDRDGADWYGRRLCAHNENNRLGCFVICCVPAAQRLAAE